MLMASDLCLPMSVRGIVEDCGFTSPEEEFQHVLKQSGKGYLSRPLIWLTNLFCKALAGYGFSDFSSDDCIAESRLPVLVIHGEKAHSCYFSKDAFADMVQGNPYAGNKELLLIPGAVHTDLYDRKDVIPFDRIQQFFQQYLK